MQVIENRKGSSGRARTYNPPVDSRVKLKTWKVPMELRIVALSM
jgi:hypothetical protein